MVELQEEIRIKVLGFLNTHGFQCSEEADYTKVLLTLFDLNRKWIPSKRRTVVYSKELKDKIENNFSNDIVDLIRFFEVKFSEGENINNHLSRNIFLFEKYDKLLNQWNVHHLHLCKDEAKSDFEMRSNRSDMYLLFLVDSEKAYFLDCFPHLKGDEFADLNFIEIVFNNKWLDVVPLIKMDHVVNLEFAVRNKEDIYQFWEHNVNVTAFEFENEYYSVGNGVTLSGNNLSDMRTVCDLNKILLKYSQDETFSVSEITVMENDSILSIVFDHCGVEKNIKIDGDIGLNCFEL